MNHPQLLTPRRVLMTADPVGGVWTFALELIRALAWRDVQVLLATMGGALRRDQQIEASRLRNLQVVSGTFKLEWMQDPWGEVSEAGQWLLELERRFNPDIVHLNGYVHGVLDWKSPLLIAGHSCVLSWWQAVRNAPAPAQWSEYESRVRRGLEQADMVVAPTRAMLDALSRHYGPLRSPTVIHNGRDVPVPTGPVHKEGFVLSAGRLWDEAKNMVTLASVARRLPWPVFVAGEMRGPDGRVTTFPKVGMLGRLSSASLAQVYARAAIYALPARYEPFGLSVVEAAGAGCALVLGDIPSLRELWDGAALFVHPSDRAGLARAITGLINDPVRLHEMGWRARVRSAEYTPRLMAAGYLSAYSDLMMESVPNSAELQEHMA